FFLLIPHPSRPTLFPYTTLFRSDSSSSAIQVDDNPPEGIGQGIPGEGLIPLSDPRQGALPPPRPERQVTRPQVVRMTHLDPAMRSEEHTSELQSRENLVCRLLLE